ncbi:UAP56-interacting factor-like isoform X1 [Chiloscyllium plagiosum]|uniref:UAP56-interacting factor-like isoform X1 n=1 Tax=Chiloscyllium plagiosum TaxID=36176 RepID=UPI001CB7C8C5|nr:UAP56-interacting factor-like isoform X1 [Chiloscyllium plagiosum]
MTENVAEPAPTEVEKSSEKIDMSLDDIIELNKRETDSTTNTSMMTRELQKRQQNSGFRKLRYYFGREVQQNVQGFNRLRRNISELQGYSRVNRRWLTQGKNITARSGGRRPVVATKGVSPLNRKASFHLDSQQTAPTKKGVQWIMRRRAQQAQKRFRLRRQRPQIPKRRNMFQNRGPSQQRKQQTQKQQRQAIIKINRGFPPLGVGDGQKKQRTRMWRQQSSSNSILTVSVPNQQAVQKRRIQHPTLNGRRRMTTKVVRNQPKGVYLGFNFKSIANQTNMTLNDRFSSMKICRRSAVSRRGGRTVTLG